MKFSEAWLREWVNPDIDTSTLCQQLTMAGLEVGSVENAAPNFESVVVSEVISVDNHPDADKLSVCKVNDGNETLQIVCGAKNVRPGLKVPLIKVGGFLTNPEGKQFKIKKSKLRGVESNGMLCSAVELGLAESSEGLYELPNDAPVGKNIREYLQLDDKIIEVDLTPNRGDCLSLRGIAREVATLNHVEFNDLCFSDVVAAKIEHEDIMPITLQAAEHCKAFSGRIVKNINASATTPIWMQEKLRRSGIRPIHPVVDISNFVMLESGQPTHTFDLSVIDSGIQVRFAKPGEKLTLLDGKEVSLQDDILVVADNSKALAMGGIMGGEHSGISNETKDVFIECAHFAPLAIAGRARRFGLHTDASHRFERGVDPALLVTVVERITQLLLEIVGGEAGPIEYVGDKFNQRDTVSVSHQRIENLLGIELSTEFVLDALNRLDIQTSEADKNYQATIPTHRFDLSIPEDLIEEVGRIHGLSSIQAIPLQSNARLKLEPESMLKPKAIKQALVERGYHEVISYSFISEEQHQRYSGSDTPLRLQNPISTELAIMRESLIPSLIATLTYNLKRQQDRVMLFEVGSRYSMQDNEIKEEKTIGILRSGPREMENWASKYQNSDFYDFKADVEAILKLSSNLSDFSYVDSQQAYLHPGQSASLIRLDDSAEKALKSAYFGQLHPQFQKKISAVYPVYIAEIPFSLLEERQLPKFSPVSTYPQSRRDLSLLVPEGLSSSELLEVCKQTGPDFLQRSWVFDVYQGKGVESGQKSVGLGLIFQEKSRTLTDEEIDVATSGIVAGLRQNCSAELRDA